MIGRLFQHSIVFALSEKEVSRVEIEDKGPGSLTFPDVLVCPRRAWSLPRARALGLNTTTLPYFVNSYQSMATATRIQQDARTRNWVEDFVKRSGMDAREIFAEAGPRCDETVEWVTYMNEDVNVTELCSRARTVGTYLGEVCIVIPSLGNVTWTGVGGGVRMGLKQVPGSVKIQEGRGYYTAGYAIMLHKSFHPFQATLLPASPGAETVFTVREVRTLRENTFLSPRECEHKLLNSSLTVTDYKALHVFIKDLSKFCGCVTLIDMERVMELWPGTEYAPTCLPSQIACMHSYGLNNMAMTHEGVPTCQLWSYDVSVSVVKLVRGEGEEAEPLGEVEDAVQIAIEFDSFQALFISLFPFIIIQFKMRITREVSKVELTDVIGALGGVSGIFLGASVITFLEFLAFLVHSIMSPFRYKNKA